MVWTVAKEGGGARVRHHHHATFETDRHATGKAEGLTELDHGANQISDVWCLEFQVRQQLNRAANREMDASEAAHTASMSVDW
jgi:hypothetical protein